MNQVYSSEFSSAAELDFIPKLPIQLNKIKRSDQERFRRLVVR